MTATAVTYLLLIMGKHLVPITREILREFYAGFPLEPVPDNELDMLKKLLEELASTASRPGSKVCETVAMPTPSRIDDCLW